jgi:hypothetical protein
VAVDVVVAAVAVAARVQAVVALEVAAAAREAAAIVAAHRVVAVSAAHLRCRALPRAPHRSTAQAVVAVSPAHGPVMVICRLLVVVQARASAAVPAVVASVVCRVAADRAPVHAPVSAVVRVVSEGVRAVLRAVPASELLVLADAQRIEICRTSLTFRVAA